MIYVCVTLETSLVLEINVRQNNGCLIALNKYHIINIVLLYNTIQYRIHYDYKLQKNIILILLNNK